MRRAYNGGGALFNEGFVWCQRIPYAGTWIILRIPAFTTLAYANHFIGAFDFRTNALLSSTIILKLRKTFCVCTMGYRMPWIERPTQFPFFCWHNSDTWAAPGHWMTCRRACKWILTLATSFTCSYIMAALCCTTNMYALQHSQKKHRDTWPHTDWPFSREELRGQLMLRISFWKRFTIGTDRHTLLGSRCAIPLAHTISQ